MGFSYTIASFVRSDGRMIETALEQTSRSIQDMSRISHMWLQEVTGSPAADVRRPRTLIYNMSLFSWLAEFPQNFSKIPFGYTLYKIF